MKLRPDEIASILREQIGGTRMTPASRRSARSSPSATASPASTASSNAVALEMLEFPHGVTGLALNLEEVERRRACSSASGTKIVEGDEVTRTGKVMSSARSARG